MSCKSAIFLENSGSNAVAEGGAIPLGNVVRRFGCNLGLSGSGIVTQGEGYYKVTGNFTIVPTAVGVESVTLYQDGNAIGSSSQEYAGTAGEPVNITVVGLVRNTCCNTRGFLEFILTSGAATVNQSNVIVEKI